MILGARHILRELVSFQMQTVDQGKSKLMNQDELKEKPVAKFGETGMKYSNGVTL